MASVALLACRVLEEEVATLQPPRWAHEEWFEIGLHDRPQLLRQTLAAAIERAEANPAVETIILVYGLCGLATAGLQPRRCRLVLPRAHDCITLLLGDRARYAASMAAEPGTFWFSPGWNRAGRTPGPAREAQLRTEYAARFEPEDVEALLETERAVWAQHGCAGYVGFPGTGDAAHAQVAQDSAAALGWKFVHHRGDPALLRDLLHGPWDEARFLIVGPGEQVAHAVDQRVIRAVPRPTIPASPTP